MKTKIVRLMDQGQPVELGVVTLVNGQAVIPEGLEFLRDVLAIDPAVEGEKFIRALPMRLSGGRLWATPVTGGGEALPMGEIVKVFNRKTGRFELTEAARGSLQAFSDAVKGAFEAKFSAEDPVTKQKRDITATDIVMDDLRLGTSLIATVDGRLVAVPFRQEVNGAITFASPENWVPVVQTYAPASEGPPEGEEEPEEQAAAVEGTWTEFGKLRIFVRRDANV